MKTKCAISLCLLFICPAILTARHVQTSNMFDAAINQIDTQSKELNQQVISGQQEGLASQKAQRLELELTNIKTEHSKELEVLKSAHENEIKALKMQITNAQQSQASQATALKDAHQEVAQLKTVVDVLQAKLASLEEQIKEYDALKSRMAEAQEKTNALTMPASLDTHKTE